MREEVNHMNISEKHRKKTSLHINVHDLNPGMMFDTPVYFADGCMFLPSGLPVKDKDIQKLKKLGINDVYTEGNLVANDSLFLNRKKSLEVSYIQLGEKKCLKIYNSIFKKMCASKII